MKKSVQISCYFAVILCFSDIICMDSEQSRADFIKHALDMAQEMKNPQIEDFERYKIRYGERNPNDLFKEVVNKKFGGDESKGKEWLKNEFYGNSDSPTGLAVTSAKISTFAEDEEDEIYKQEQIIDAIFYICRNELQRIRGDETGDADNQTEFVTFLPADWKEAIARLPKKELENEDLNDGEGLGFYEYTHLPSGHLRIGYTGHVYLSLGKAVAGAGTVIITGKRRIAALTPNSGHHLPGPDLLRQTAQSFNTEAVPGGSRIKFEAGILLDPKTNSTRAYFYNPAVLHFNNLEELLDILNDISAHYVTMSLFAKTDGSGIVLPAGEPDDQGDTTQLYPYPTDPDAYFFKGSIHTRKKKIRSFNNYSTYFYEKLIKKNNIERAPRETVERLLEMLKQKNLLPEGGMEQISDRTDRLLRGSSWASLGW